MYSRLDYPNGNRMHRFTFCSRNPCSAVNDGHIDDGAFSFCTFMKLRPLFTFQTIMLIIIT